MRDMTLRSINFHASGLISETYRFAFYLFLLSALVFVTEREMRQGEWIAVERAIFKTLIVQSQSATVDFIFCVSSVSLKKKLTRSIYATNIYFKSRNYLKNLLHFDYSCFCTINSYVF